MTLKYTGQEAVDLLKNVFPDTFEARLDFYKNEILRLTKIYNCDNCKAFEYYVKAGYPHIQNIQMLAALQILETELSTTNKNLTNKIKQLEDEKNQLGQQLFFLESSTTIQGKNELRQIYIEQLQHKNRQIQQHLTPSMLLTRSSRSKDLTVKEYYNLHLKK